MPAPTTHTSVVMDLVSAGRDETRAVSYQSERVGRGMVADDRVGSRWPRGSCRARTIDPRWRPGHARYIFASGLECQCHPAGASAASECRDLPCGSYGLAGENGCTVGPDSRFAPAG